MDVEHGIIKAIVIYGDFFSKLDVSNIESRLIGINHVESEVKKVLSTFNIINDAHIETTNRILYIKTPKIKLIYNEVLE